MALTRSYGNMYSWVTHKHTHLGGKCPHECQYCYVQTGMGRLSGRYSGELRLYENELLVNYGRGKTIFIEHMNDLFAFETSVDWITRILTHVRLFPENKYVFQTKNPGYAFRFRKEFPQNPRDFIIGTTLESDRTYPTITKAPTPSQRYTGLSLLKYVGMNIFITIEPVMDFSWPEFGYWIASLQPSFVAIGGDSKGCHLPEPSAEKLAYLIEFLQRSKIEIRNKRNLDRILGVPGEKK